MNASKSPPSVSMDVIKPLALSIEQTRTVLGIARSTVYLMLKKGDLQGIHIGRRHLVTSASIERFLQRQGVTVAA